MAKFDTSKKKHKNDGLDVLDEIKEPFSFASFYEDHIVKNVKKIKKMLDERGILFFFLSPFQQRNRLIIQLVLIVFGITLGVVPRCMNLLDQTKERNANSEMAGLVEKETVIRAESINIKPLGSSQYDKQHVLAFLITPSGGSAIPSIADRYYVNVSASRGVSYAEDVEFSYDVIPFTDTDRLMLIYTDHRNQNDTTGVYNVVIENKEDALPLSKKFPLEVVLSNTQKTTDLFDEEGIHLNSLSDILFNGDKQPIAEARTAVEQALSDYTLEVERIQNQPVDMNPIPSPAVLKTFVRDNEFYPLLTDKSDTADILSMTELTPEELMINIRYAGAIEMNGIKYDAEHIEQLKTSGVEPTDNELLVTSELSNLQKAIDNVSQAVTRLNAATRARFDTLKNFKLIFNQPIDPTTFTNKDHVTLVIQALGESSEQTGEETSESSSEQTTETSEETEAPVTETSEETEAPVTEEQATEAPVTEEIPPTEETVEEPPVQTEAPAE